MKPCHELPRAIVTFQRFGKKWVSVACIQWHATRQQRLRICDLPAWVRRVNGSLIVCRASIEEKRLRCTDWEPGSQVDRAPTWAEVLAVAPGSAQK